MTPRWLHRFALFTALLTLALLAAGGLVTSHGVGMAVPDWPNTFGYNMFFFPFSQWVGGVFYEHSHRLIASATGLCTAILAVWIHGKNARPLLQWLGIAFLLGGAATLILRPAHRPDAIVGLLSGLASFGASFVWPRCEPARPWLRRLALAAFFAVVLQGILGGLRVVLFKDQIGIFHATLAQLFFALTCALALFTSPWWEKRFGSPWFAADRWSFKQANGDLEFLPVFSAKLAPLCLTVTVLILAQLILGATMRHQHAGLAIPDFPSAYGKIWPAMDPASVARYNQQRVEVVDVNPITAAQIVLQMVHRLMALAIFIAILSSAWLSWRLAGFKNLTTRLALVWTSLVITQVLLGAATIWSHKAADIATLHVLVGALLLSLGTLLSIILFKQVSFVRRTSQSPVSSSKVPGHSFPADASPALGLD